MNIKIVEEGILVSQNTKSGYIFCKWGGCFDMSFPSSKTRRGRVDADGDVCPAITSTGMMLMVVEHENRVN